MTTGEKIAKLRKEHNYTQEQFADIMNVSRQSISKWEQNLAYPDTEKLIKLCSIFHCSIDYILREEITHKSSIYEGTNNYLNGKTFHNESVKENKPTLRKKTDTKYFEGKTPILELIDVAKHYMKDGKVKTVLHGINIAFYENEFIALTGESGSGKTTLMNLISGSLGYDNGDINYLGKSFSEFDSKEWLKYETDDIGYVAQDNKLLMQYTVEQNVLSTLLVKGYELEYCYERVREILKLVGMEKYSKQRIVKLSAGQRQRVAIARVLAKNPKIILADEITANLDEDTAIKILELLKKLSATCTIIFITHNFPQVIPYVTRHIEIKNNTVYIDELMMENIDDKKSENHSLSSPTIAKKSNFISYFVKWNIKARSEVGIIVTLLFLIVGVILFGLGDLYFINHDDITVKEFDYSVFKNSDDCRIIIKRKDEGLITEEDLNRISQIKYVNSVEKYDLVNDVYYFYKPEKDHSIYFQYNSCLIQSNVAQFMRSASSITDKDIIAGRKPSAFGEVAVPESDSALLDTEIIVYFRLPFTNRSTNCCQVMKVVGVTNSDDTQLYFSYQDCDMFANICKPGEVNLLYLYDEEKDIYKSSASTIPVINKNLKGDNAVVDYQFLTYFSKGYPNGKCRLKLNYYDHYGIENAKEKTCDINAEAVFMTEERYIQLDQDIKDEISVISTTGPFIEVGYDTFYKIYDEGSNQMSAFITDYLETDAVLKAINATGEYEAFSSYRLSMNDINTEKSASRAKLFGIIIITLTLLLGTACFLVSTLMCFTSSDHQVFKHIGVSEKERIKMMISQYYCYFAIAALIICITMCVLKIVDFDILHNYLKYLRTKELVVCGFIYILYSIVTLAVSCGRINKIVDRG